MREACSNGWGGDLVTDDSVRELLAQMSSGEPGPSAGSAAGLVTAVAAALVAKTARLSRRQLGDAGADERAAAAEALRDRDRKSTRLNSSHVASSYAVFCLK